MNLEETIWENNHDYIWQQTWDDIYDIIKQFDQQIEKEIGDSYHEDDLRELVEDFRDDHPGVSVNLETLLSRMNNIPVRFPFYSNYDCINSHWLENDAGYWFEFS